MAKSKLEMQIEAAQKQITDGQARLKLLQNQQAEKNRKERNHRLCKRHGFLESVLPDTINLTDAQYEEFVKNHVANKFGKQAIADYMAKNARAMAALAATQKAEETETATPATAETTDAKPQSGDAPAPTVAGQNSNGNASTHTPQNSGTPENQRAATA